jgi:hypothetical protein
VYVHVTEESDPMEVQKMILSPVQTSWQKSLYWEKVHGVTSLVSYLISSIC